MADDALPLQDLDLVARHGRPSVVDVQVRGETHLATALDDLCFPSAVARERDEATAAKA
jgi:hypothetical protein